MSFVDDPNWVPVVVATTFVLSVDGLTFLAIDPTIPSVLLVDTADTSWSPVDPDETAWTPWPPEFPI